MQGTGIRLCCFSLTHGEGVVDTEAAKDSAHIAGVKESVPLNHHLKGFWDGRKHIAFYVIYMCPEQKKNLFNPIYKFI